MLTVQKDTVPQEIVPSGTCVALFVILSLVTAVVGFTTLVLMCLFLFELTGAITGTREVFIFGLGITALVLCPYLPVTACAVSVSSSNPAQNVFFVACVAASLAITVGAFVGFMVGNTNVLLVLVPAYNVVLGFVGFAGLGVFDTPRSKKSEEAV